MFQIFKSCGAGERSSGQLSALEPLTARSLRGHVVPSIEARSSSMPGLTAERFRRSTLASLPAELSGRWCGTPAPQVPRHHGIVSQPFPYKVFPQVLSFIIFSEPEDISENVHENLLEGLSENSAASTPCILPFSLSGSDRG
jgi:hypothetical protein